ncbi:MAG TPA: YbhB/YbcL family Raf kinase inhibitor-like protein [Caulobacteraceae bacterium]|jgi:Raf kinase inhibitor-like YbhB/YbcL family protein
MPIALGLVGMLLVAPLAHAGADAARISAPSHPPIVVGTTAIGPDHVISARNTAYGRNLSPEVNWSPVPGARAYALILDDPDASHPAPFVHWLVWDIPGAVHRLAEGIVPAPAVQGRNGRGEVGYFGPRPPSGTHHYHLRLYALRGPLALAAGADREALDTAMKGKVLASGEIIGLVSAPKG